MSLPPRNHENHKNNWNTVLSVASFILHPIAASSFTSPSLKLHIFCRSAGWWVTNTVKSTEERWQIKSGECEAAEEEIIFHSGTHSRHHHPKWCGRFIAISQDEKESLTLRCDLLNPTSWTRCLVLLLVVVVPFLTVDDVTFTRNRVLWSKSSLNLPSSVPVCLPSLPSVLEAAPAAALNPHSGLLSVYEPKHDKVTSNIACGRARQTTSLTKSILSRCLFYMAGCTELASHSLGTSDATARQRSIIPFRILCAPSRDVASATRRRRRRPPAGRRRARAW